MKLINTDALEKMLRDIEHAKNIDTVPVVHAHWIKGLFADLKCSNCSFLLCVPEAMIPSLAYCPHCGAKMDEKETCYEA